VKLEKLINHNNNSEDKNQYKKIKKFKTNLDNNYDISEIYLPPMKCLEVRVILVEYEGYAPGMKLGIGIKDEAGTICNRKCKCPSFACNC